MTVRIYFKNTSKHPDNDTKGKDVERPHLDNHQASMSSAGNLDKDFFAEHGDYLTILDYVREGKGFEFIPGVYKSTGYKVEISPKNKVAVGIDGGLTSFVLQQTVSGRFDNIELLESFWEQLLSGNLLPTEPLCQKLDPTTTNYAKQAAKAVSDSLEIRELRSRVDQLMNHIVDLEQIVQDRVLTPQVQ